MIQLGGAFLAGFVIGPAVDAWITRELARRGLDRPESWRPATRWALSVILGTGWAAISIGVGWSGVLAAHMVWVAVTASVVVTDLEHRLIPNRILYPGGALTALLLLVGGLLDGTPGRLGSAALGGRSVPSGHGSAVGAGAGSTGNGRCQAVGGAGPGLRLLGR